MLLQNRHRLVSRHVLALAVAGLSFLSSLNGFGWAEDAVAPRSVHITLLQVNDVYQISPVDKGKSGGLARLATLRQQIKAENPNTFLVLAGDTLSPSIASNLFQGKQMVEVWNQLGLDVATLGNHEFDFGNEVLLQRLKESNFKWVIANVVDKNTGKPFADLPPYIIKEVDGVKVGFFGLLTPDTEHASHPGPNVVFKDPIYTACETIARMKRDGADVIVAVTHLPMGEDKRMARSLNHQVALIMGGHEHTLLTSAAGGTPIFKMGSDARNLGRMDLYVNPSTHQLESIDWQIIPVTAAVPEDPAVAATVKTYEDKINTALGQVIGNTTVELDARQETNRAQETNLGNYVADIYRTRLGADIGYINGGSIRSNTTYGPGELTRRDVLTFLPFGNQVVKVSLTGDTLKKALENGVSRLGDEEAGRFPQVSGLTFVYDGAKPVGSRVISVTVNGQPLNPGKTYTLATTAYLIGGGDDYLMLKDAKVLINPEEAPIEADIVQDAILKAKTIAPKVEGRIRRVDGAKPAATKPAATTAVPAKGKR
ncbi:MAG: bifunctional metallophosphatase/5-nucleotidase [Vampirovibrio sp.]|jgi:5'-nucleotidase|nr:bifunctional metallophosphatase/5-nucleotidase [Vampirovibrio sp.]